MEIFTLKQKIDRCVEQYEGIRQVPLKLKHVFFISFSSEGRGVYQLVFDDNTCLQTEC